MIDRIYLKNKAKLLIFTSKPSPLLAGAVLTFVAFVLMFFQYTGDVTEFSQLTQSGQYTFDQMAAAIWSDFTSNTVHLIVQIAFSLINTYISFGLIYYSYRVAVGEEGLPVSEMFPPFLLYIKHMIITLMVSVLAIIGFLFFFFPGIAVLLWYSQAKYVLIENPKMSVFKCMKQSRIIMRGRVIEYLVLLFSFIGWSLLTSFTVATGVWTYPYTNITYALYYKEISGASEKENFQFFSQNP